MKIGFNPLRPNNDLSQTSHCNIKDVSVSEVMIMITMIIIVIMTVKVFNIIIVTAFVKSTLYINISIALYIS